MKKISKISTLLAFAVLMGGMWLHGLEEAQAAAQAELSFSPATVRNGQAFTIKVSGAPASSPTTLWVDNGDGKGFVNFGEWMKTNGNGDITVSRTLFCSGYNTLEPGRSVAVGNRALIQKLYLEFPDGARTVTATHTKDCTVASAPEPPSQTQPGDSCISLLGYYSDNAPPTFAYVNNHEVKLNIGEQYSGISDTNSPDILSDIRPSSINPKITVLDPMPAGLSITHREVIYSRIEPIRRIFVSGTPTTEDQRTVRVRTEYKSGAGTCVDTGFIKLNIVRKAASRPDPEKERINTAPSSAGKIRFVKEAVRPTESVGGDTTLQNILAIRDKFVVDSKCGAMRYSSLWTVREDGSLISARSACQDATGASGGTLYGHGNVGSNLLLNWTTETDSFSRMNFSGATTWLCLADGVSGELGDCADIYGRIDNTVHYALGPSGKVEVVSVSAKDTEYRPVAGLRNKLLDSSGLTIGLPDWNRLGTTALTANRSYIGYGNLLLEVPPRQSAEWTVYKMSAGGAKTFVKTLPIRAEARYFLDNSTWLPKMAFVEKTASGSAKIYVYKLSGEDMVLDRTIDMGSGFRYTAGEFAIWNDYVVFSPNAASRLELWRNGQKLDDVAVFISGKNSPRELEISQNGYLAVMTQTGDNAVYVYKLDMESPGSGVGNPLPNPLPTPPATTTRPTACDAGYSNLCDQIEELKRQLCALVPTATFCSTAP